LCLPESAGTQDVSHSDNALFSGIEKSLGITFSRRSSIIGGGRTGVNFGLIEARKLLLSDPGSRVLIAATDSLLSWENIRGPKARGRLLAKGNSDGFLPGEAAGALLVEAPSEEATFCCEGLGSSHEPAHIDSTQPLRGNGMTEAIQQALDEAGCAMHELDFRVTDLSGEQYYFKEASLALSRTLKKRKEEFPLWHPAECIGDTGATSGVAAIVIAESAIRLGYAPGANVLCHIASDGGERSAAVFRYRAFN
jgi:3-oxoacyl-[acyl-carrier-protein] synthase-1